MPVALVGPAQQGGGLDQVSIDDIVNLFGRLLIDRGYWHSPCLLELGCYVFAF